MLTSRRSADGSRAALCRQTKVPIVATPITVVPKAQQQAAYERYEGMLVTVKGPLTVTNNYGLGRYGEVRPQRPLLPLLPLLYRVFHPVSCLPLSLCIVDQRIQLTDINLTMA